MSLILRKYFWAVNLITITICAFFGAKAVGWVVQANFPTPAKRPVNSSPITDPGSSTPQSRDISKILERNIFCSTCEKVQEMSIARPGEPGSEGSSPAEAGRTTLNIKLVATLVSSRDPSWSFAAILDVAEGKTRLHAIGHKVPGDAVITDIMERKVLLQNGGRHEYLDMESGESAQPGAPTSEISPEAASTHKPSAGLAGEEDIGKGIRKIGEGKFEIDRKALDKVLGNTTMLARSARIVPSVKDGQPNGFKLYAIRPGSVFSLLGINNGDLVSAINGHAITTPDKALEVYTKLRSASHVTISMTRNGAPTTYEYNIR